MSEENKVIEEVVEETNVEPTATEEQPKQEGPNIERKSDGTFKVDFSKTNSTDDQQEEVEEQKQEVVAEEETQVIQEITDEDTEEQPIVEAKQEIPVEETSAQTQAKLPENIESLVKFMEDTGGSIEDYVRLNADYSKVDNDTLLREYYKSTKPHLDASEVEFLIEDSFSYDEELDDDRDVRKKKLALKEEVAKAKKFLGSLKDEYYKEVKLGSKLTREQQEAINFYNEYNQQQSTANDVREKQYKQFQQSTNNLFSENFKGFDFRVGDKKFRYNVKNAQAVKENQSDISNFVREFLDENDMIKDAAGYHRALYAGKNIDKIVQHFYEQGKADAIKETAIKSKNIDMGARTVNQVVDAGGMKVKVLGGDNSSRLKVKIKR